MGADFTLVDQTLLCVVDKFDRIFDSQYVAVLGLVDVIHHSSERRGLARASRAGHEHQSPGLVGDLLENLWRLEVFERQYRCRNDPKNGAGAALLYKRVHAETREIGYRKREV